MLCEICHKAEAATVIHVKRDGEEKELFVCKRCAAAAKAPPQKTDDVSVSVKTEDGAPPPAVADFLKATLGLIGMAAQAQSDKAQCPSCKRTWETIRTSGRLGCPNCWKVFAKNIRKEFLGGQFARRHTGATPASAAGEDTRAGLERALKAAVADENYEKAAALRRQLDALDKDAGKGTGSK